MNSEKKTSGSVGVHGAGLLDYVCRKGYIENFLNKDINKEDVSLAN